MNRFFNDGRFKSGRTRLDVDNITENLRNVWEDNRFKIIPAIVITAIIILIVIIIGGSIGHHDHHHDTELNAVIHEHAHAKPAKPAPIAAQSRWYMSEYGVMQLNSIRDMMNTNLAKPCIELSDDDIKHKIVSTVGTSSELDDLTLIGHMLCHHAITESVHYPNDAIIVTPNMINIKTLRAAEEQKPQRVFKKGPVAGLLLDIQNAQLSNLCMMAVIHPKNNPHSHSIDQKHHLHHEYETALDLEETLPFGTFVHRSRRITTASNQHAYEEDYSIWDREPTKGECAIIFNPRVHYDKPKMKTGYEFRVPIIDNVIFSDLIAPGSSLIYKSWRGDEKQLSFNMAQPTEFEENLAHVTNFLRGDVHIETKA